MKYSILIILILKISFGYALSGKITDSSNNALENVMIKTAVDVSFSDEKGLFKVKVNTNNDTILFHKIGYKDINIPAKKFSGIVIMKENPLNLKGMKIISENTSSYVIKAKEESKSLAEVLTFDNELEIKGKDITGAKKSVAINGNLAKHTIVMLDGIVLNPQGRDFDISQIPIEIVEKVEIIKNNVSSISGSGGIGGAINIVTKNTNNSGFKAKTIVGYGSFDMKKLSQTLSYSKNFRLNLLLKRVTAKNNFKYTYILSNDKPLLKRKNNASIINTANLTFLIKNLKFNFLFNDIYKELPGTIDKMPMFDKAFLKGQNYKYILSYHKDIYSFSNDLDIYFFYDKTSYDNTKSTIPIYYSQTKTTDKKTGLKIKQSYKKRGVKLELGEEFKRECFDFIDKNTDTNSIPNKNRNVYSIFALAGYFYKKDLLEMEPKIHIRNDFQEHKNYSSYRVENNFKFNWLIQNSLAFYFGNSYSLPSFYEIYWKGDLQTQGNKDLKAEYSKGWGLDYKLYYENQSVVFSYNENKIKNLIYWYKSVLAWKPGNIADALIRHYTVSYKKSTGKISFNASFSKTVALDKTVLEDGTHSIYYNKKLINVPEYNYGLQTEFNFDYLTLQIDFKEFGKRWVTRDNLWGYLKPYSIVNGKIKFKKEVLKYDINFVLSVSNIFDKRFDTYQLMPGPGINYEFDITIQKK